MKYKLKLLLFCILTLFTSNYTFGQQTVIKKLKVGDKAPDIILSKFVNSKNRPVKLSSLYKNGLLIIDFWATWCLPCIHEIRVADSLAKKHESLTILSVSIDDSLKAASFLKEHPELHTKNIIISCDDKLLSQYFKHSTIPHNIWINRYGIIKLISEGDAVTDSNVIKYLEPN